MTQIIGNGMIAKSFCHYPFSKKCVLIAAGISNSLENKSQEFQREENLILNTIAHYPAHQIVYFSTCSVLQLATTPYIEHKSRMENLVAEKAHRYAIFRLPQVAGVTNNTTLVSFLVKQILDNNLITIQLNARRNLIDVNDVVRIVHALIEENEVANCTINIAAKQSVLVSDIVLEVAKIMNRDYRGMNVDEGESYAIPIEFLEQKLRRDDPIWMNTYWKNVLLKYVPAVAELAESAELSDSSE